MSHIVCARCSREGCKLGKALGTTTGPWPCRATGTLPGYRVSSVGTTATAATPYLHPSVRLFCRRSLLLVSVLTGSDLVSRIVHFENYTTGGQAGRSMAKQGGWLRTGILGWSKPLQEQSSWGASMQEQALHPRFQPCRFDSMLWGHIRLGDGGAARPLLLETHSRLLQRCPWPPAPPPLQPCL